MAQSILPNVDVTVLDGALGLASGVRDGVCAQIGESSLGDHLVHPVTDAGQVAALFGTGPLADALRDALGAGARLVLARRLAAETAGEVEVSQQTPGWYATVEPDSGNASPEPGIDDVGSSPGLLEMTLMLKVTTGGTIGGGAAVAWSTDSGSTWSDPVAVAAAIEIEVGLNSLMVEFPAGTYVQDDGWLVTVQQGAGEVTVSGNPTVDADVVVQIAITGGRNAGAFEIYDVASGHTLVPQTTIPLDGSYTSPWGFSVLFSDAVHARLDAWRVTAVAGLTGLGQLAAAVGQVKSYPVTPEVIHVVGATSSATWAALHALAEEFAQAGKFLHILVETDTPDDEAASAEWIESVADDVESAGSLRRVSLYAGWVVDGDDVRSGAAQYLGHLMARQKVSHSPGRVIDGPVRGVSAFGPTDEGDIAALDALGCTTMRRIDGLGGAYVTNGRMLVDDTSDFRWVEWRRVMDKACREVRLAASRYLHFGMDAEGQRALQVQCQAALNRMVAAGECAAGAVEIPEGQDIIGTSTVRVKVRVQPIPSARWIDVEIAFEAQV